MSIATCQAYAQRVAKGINDSVDLRRQAAFATAYFLFEVPPFAPDPC